MQIFGAAREAARIESSKVFAKELMKKYNIPCARSESFSEYSQAKEYLQKQKAPIVIKADGLAAGKGVTVAETIPQAMEVLAGMMGGQMVPTADQAAAAGAQAGQATQQAAKVKTTPPNVPTSATTETPEAKEVEAPSDELKTGEVLAAIPAALQAVDMLFNQQNTLTQRPAPAAGFAGGQVVGQFAQPYGGTGNSIGQLLAALPGIR